MRVLTPNRTPDYFAAHPDELLAGRNTAALSGKWHSALAALGSHKIRYLTSATCAPGHERSPRKPAHSSATGTSANWSGYQSGYEGDMLGALMDWNVPSVSTAANSSAYSSIWPGIGEGYTASDSLVQDGTEQDVSCVLSVCNHTYYPWVEVVPEETQLRITNLAVAPGDAIESFVEWDAIDGEAYFEIDNVTTQTGIYFIQYTDAGFTGTGSTAEWIVERTQVGSNYPALANFGTLSVPLAFALEGASLSDPNLSYPGIVDLNPVEITMTSCSGSLTLARPGVLTGNDGDAFTDTFVQRGSSEAVSTC